MFMDKNKPDNKINTLIGDQCNIKGSLNGNGLLQIDGHIEGNVYWQDDVIISDTCTCEGNIECINAYVNGVVIGNVTCTETLTIEGCGKIHGDIFVNMLIVREGGILDGKCNMTNVESTHIILPRECTKTSKDILNQNA